MRKFLIILLFLLVGLFLYARFIEPQELITNEYTINDKNLPESFDGLKIIHFSDVLYKDDITMLKKTVKKINNANADIVIFTGDLISKKGSKSHKDAIITELSKIKVNEYKYAILGDNDTKLSHEILEESNFIILNNTSEYIFRNGNTPIVIAGGNEITKELLDKDVSIDSTYSIVLTHKPDDYEKIKDLNPSLVLAGHSLGGELRVPLWGALIKQEGAKKYIDANYKNLYVSYGIGTSPLGMRFLNKPSINVYRLYTK